MRFRKKPVEIEALAWLPDDPRAAGEMSNWLMFCGATFDLVSGVGASSVLRIVTLEGAMDARPGDWIIRGVQGEFYPCKPDIFAATYDEVQP